MCKNQENLRKIFKKAKPAWQYQDIFIKKDKSM